MQGASPQATVVCSHDWWPRHSTEHSWPGGHAMETMEQDCWPLHRTAHGIPGGQVRVRPMHACAPLQRITHVPSSQLSQTPSSPPHARSGAGAAAQAGSASDVESPASVDAGCVEAEVEVEVETAPASASEDPSSPALLARVVADMASVVSPDGSVPAAPVPASPTGPSKSGFVTTQPANDKITAPTTALILSN